MRCAGHAKEREIQIGPDLVAVVAECPKREAPKPASAPGNIGDLLTMGLFVLAMAVLMVQFLNGTHLIQSKSGVSQLCRQYLLSMETRGYLDSGEEAMLLEDLRQLGVENADLSGTTRSPVPFGSVITLQIRGTLGGNNEFTEVRASTAKY